ncbi:MAG TPA: SDR family oxidoreductase [Trebonia sp.]|nr:SDR family oxidoreductase [Trebonia sp.]
MTSTTPQKIIIVTGASSGFGRMAVEQLGKAGHVVYAAMRDIDGHNQQAAADLVGQADNGGPDLHPVELDVTDEDSVDAAIASVIAKAGRIDVIVHNAGHMVLGPAEAFTTAQYASVYDVNVLGAQRVNRAALPYLRAQRSGLLLWVGSTSTRGGTPPFLAPYFAAKAAMDALAVSYASELIRFGIDTTIVVPGSFTRGTNHFAHAGKPYDTGRASAYDEEYGQLMTQVQPKLGALAPADADPQEVARVIAEVVETPAGQRPLRVHVDPANDGSEIVSAVADRIRADFFHRIGLDSLLTAHSSL